MKRYDVVVVGGGPIGSVAARCAAEQELAVLLIERRPRIEGPVACAGLVSLRTLPILGSSDRCVVRRIRAVTVHGPREVAVLRSAEDKAVVIDRSTLERELLERAAQASVDVRCGATAVQAKPGAVRVRYDDASEETVRTAVVIGADGPRSSTAAWFGLPACAENLRAVQAEIASDAIEEDGVEVFLGRRFAPGFFAWTVPAESGRLRVGLAGHDAADSGRRLDTLLDERFPGRPVLSRIEALIPIPPAPRVAGDGILLVGDAAAQVKPWSGGGLYFGGLCARLAGRFAARAVRAGEVSARGLHPYEEACRRAVGRETRAGLALRTLLLSLDDPQIDAALAALHDGELNAYLACEADIDHPSRLLTRMASHPRLWTYLFSLWDAVRGSIKVAERDAPHDDGTPTSSDFV